MSDTKSQGIGFLSLLGLAFIVLKLCKIIDWHWAFVTLPLWGGLAIFILTFIVIISIIAFKNMISKKSKDLKERHKILIDETEIKKSPFMQRIEDAVKKQEALKKNKTL